MTNKELMQDMRATFDKCLEIASKKNSDYADADDAFKNFRSSLIIGVNPERAILVRMMDKMTRIGNLSDAMRANAVSDETIYDTLDDIINYAAILKAYHHDKIKTELLPF